MATYIYLNRGGFIPINSEDSLDVAYQCCIDFKTAMRVIDSNEGTDMCRVDEDDRSTFHAWAHGSYDPKVAIRVGKLFDQLSKTVYVPDASEEPRMRDSIQNPMISGEPITLGIYTISRDGVYTHDVNDGDEMFVSVREILTNHDDVIRFKLGGSDSSVERDEFNIMDLVQKLEDALLELNDRSSYERGDEIRRKIDSIAKLIRVMESDQSK